MMVGCYSLDLYCDNEATRWADGSDEHGHAFGSFPWQYTDETGSACRARARAAGWKINIKTGAALCPQCAKKGHAS